MAVTIAKLYDDPAWAAAGVGLMDRIQTPRITFDGSLFLGTRWDQTVVFDGRRNPQSGTIPGGRSEWSYFWSADGTDKAVFMYQTSGNTAYLIRSADGTANFATVLTYTGTGAQSCLPHSLVDCGSGVLFFFEYDTDGKRIWVSVDGGQNWGDNAPGFDDSDPLITAAADTIRHYHGAVWDSTTSKLYIMVGDSNSASRILICDDIADLRANPGTWKTRWGLDSSGQVVDEDYVLNDNLTAGLPDSQDFRAVSMVLKTVGSTRYAVWALDSSSVGGQSVFKMDLSTGVKTEIGKITGAGWWMLETASGHLVLATDSELTGADYSNGHDKYVRLYGIDANLANLREMVKLERNDSDSPSGTALWYGLTEAFGLVCGYCNRTDPGTICGRVDSLVNLLANGNTWDQFDLLLASSPSGINYFTNPQFDTDTTGWAAWHATIARDDTTYPVGSFASLKITPNGINTSGWGSQSLSVPIRKQLGGHFVTVSFSVKLTDIHADQIPMVIIDFGDSKSSVWTIPASYWDGEWHHHSITTYVPENASLIYLKCCPNYGGPAATSTGLMYIGDVRLVVGTRAAAGNMPGIDALA